MWRSSLLLIIPDSFLSRVLVHEKIPSLNYIKLFDHLTMCKQMTCLIGFLVLHSNASNDLLEFKQIRSGLLKKISTNFALENHIYLIYIYMCVCVCVCLSVSK